MNRLERINLLPESAKENSSYSSMLALSYDAEVAAAVAHQLKMLAEDAYEALAMIECFGSPTEAHRIASSVSDRLDDIAVEFACRATVCGSEANCAIYALEQECL